MPGFPVHHQLLTYSAANQPLHSHVIIVCQPLYQRPQAWHFAAAAHKTTVGLGVRANIPRGFASQAGSRGPRSRRGPAGEGKAGGSGTELPPPAWSRHVAAAPLGTAEKVRQEPGSPGGGEKVRRPHPHPLFQYRPVQPQTMEAQRFHSHFPLLGGAAAPRPLPPRPGRRRRRVGRQQGAPYLHSPLLDRAPSPYPPTPPYLFHFPLHQPRPTRMRRPLPPSQAREGEWRWRMGSLQPVRDPERWGPRV